MTCTTNSPEETEALGASLAQELEPGAVLAFTGDLGAGKTAFVRGLARGLGCPGRVTSPTFTIVNEYEGGRLPLFHFDMYRIDRDGLEDTGFYEYLDSGRIVACEWCENIEDTIPKDAIRVRIEYGRAETERIITISMKSSCEE